MMAFIGGNSSQGSVGAHVNTVANPPHGSVAANLLPETMGKRSLQNNSKQSKMAAKGAH